MTLEQGSIISSLAAILATQPSTMRLRYTNGVLPINYKSQPEKETQNEQNQNIFNPANNHDYKKGNENSLLQWHLSQSRTSPPPFFFLFFKLLQKHLKENGSEKTICNGIQTVVDSFKLQNLNEKTILVAEKMNTITSSFFLFAIEEKPRDFQLN